MLYNINAYPLLMYMLPGETLQGHLFQAELFIKTFGQIPYIKAEYEIRPDVFIANSAAFIPFPGAPCWKNIEKEGVLLTKKWECFSTELITFIPKSLFEDIPKKNADSIDSATIRRLNYFCKRAIKMDISFKMDDLLEVLWRSIDGKSSIFSIAKTISKIDEKISWETSLAFTTLAILTLLLNDNLIIPTNSKYII
jgi:hypothetical protein